MKFIRSICFALSLTSFSGAEEVQLSSRLAQIAGHLGAGGVHFSVTDAQDDLKNLGEGLDQLLAIVAEDELPPGFQVGRLLDGLGLYGIAGNGSSARKEGELWHNRSFMMTDGKHEGLLSLFGEESGKPAAHGFAPADADLVLETTLDLRQVEKMGRTIAKAFGPAAQEEVGSAFAQELMGAGLSLADLFVDFTVRGIIVIWLDDGKNFELNPEVQLPVPHLAARLDNAGVVWRLLKASLEGAPRVTMTEIKGEVVVQSEGKTEETPWGEIEPQLRWNSETEQLTFALTDSDLAVCRGKGPRLTTDTDFQAASVGFPEEANGLAYVSKGMLKLALTVGEQFIPAVDEEVQGILNGLLPFLSETADKGGIAASFVVLENGFLGVGNFPYPVKGGSLSPGLGGVATVSVLAGITTPLILRAQKAGDEVMLLNDLKGFAGAQLLYRAENGKYATTWDQLLKGAFIDEEGIGSLRQAEFQFLVEADYEEKSLRDVLAMVPSPSSPNEVIVARVDGSVIVISMRELQLQLEKQK